MGSEPIYVLSVRFRDSVRLKPIGEVLWLTAVHYTLMWDGVFLRMMHKETGHVVVCPMTNVVQMGISE